jgi:hypothetical protein
LRVKRDIRKLDDLDPSERLAAFWKMFPGSPDQPVRPGRSFLDILKAEADDGDDDDGSHADHPSVRLARLLAASGKFPDHAQALDHLLNTSHGQALIARLKAAETEKDPPMQDSVHAIMKSGSIATTCAAIIQKGSTTITEHELVEAATKVAAERHPELSPSQAFAKIYTAATDEARVLQKAISIAKAMPFVADSTPVMVGGVDAVREANDATEQSKAYAQLQQIGRDRWRTASEAVQFANAMTDPKNAGLAAKAHRRPSTTTSFAFPSR